MSQLMQNSNRVGHIGQRFGNYRLLRFIGRGGFSDVYLGEHIRDKTKVAVKVLKAEVGGKSDIQALKKLKEFIIEASIFNLKHPHILPLLAFGLGRDDIPFLVFQYAPNGSLRNRHPKGQVVPLSTVLSYVRPLADALQYAHDRKLVHRDVKPENMLIGKYQDIMLGDFGIASFAHDTYSWEEQNVAGTVTYMAPEQILRKARPESDQYALAIVIYEWLCGKPPFESEERDPILRQMQLIRQHLEVKPLSFREKNPHITIPLAIEQVIMKALAKDFEHRFGSVSEFAQALEEASQTVAMNELRKRTTQLPHSNYRTAVLDEERHKIEVSHPTGHSFKFSRGLLLALVSSLLCLLLLGGSFALFTGNLNFFKSTGGNSTFIPLNEQLSSDFTIYAVTGTPDASKSQIHARILTASSPFSSKTVNATGQKESSGVAATGTLTFLNSLTSAQTVRAGTVFTGKDGVQVANTVDAVIPPAIPFAGTFGKVTVPAHAVRVGHNGNISALDINGSCCTADNSIFVQGSAFSGGEDPQNYTFVQQSDIDGVVNALEPSLRQQAQNNLKGEAHTDEQLVGATSCSPTVEQSQNVGDKALSVIVTVAVSCNSEAYKRSEAQAMAIQLLRNQAAKSLGAKYVLTGNIVTGQPQVTNIDTTTETVTLLVTARGTWVLQSGNSQKG